MKFRDISNVFHINYYSVPDVAQDVLRALIDSYQDLPTKEEILGLRQLIAEIDSDYEMSSYLNRSNPQEKIIDVAISYLGKKYAQEVIESLLSSIDDGIEDLQKEQPSYWAAWMFGVESRSWSVPDSYPYANGRVVKHHGVATIPMFNGSIWTAANTNGCWNFTKIS
jgi:hypothetical protein